MEGGLMKNNYAPVRIFDEEEQKKRDALFAGRMKFEIKKERLLRKYGASVAVVMMLTAWTASTVLITSAITANNVRKETEEMLLHQYNSQMQAYIDQQEEERRASEFLSGDASLQAAIDVEADFIAKAISPMKTKRMKLSMLWNILARVDNAGYANSVQEVVSQKDQWMFYSEDNPIKDDDRALAVEQLVIWHSGRYPAGFSSEYVFGEWSPNDYVLRDKWEKDSSTNYWRYPEQ